MKVLVVGPSPERSKGGMATVILEIIEDKELNEQIEIDVFESFIDGSLLKRFFYSIYAFFLFCFTKKNYDIYHIHAASRSSTFRKGYYVKKVKKWNKKIILHIHGAQYIEFYNEISNRKKRKVIDILKSSDMVIALSNNWKKKFDKLFNLKNCVVLENGINNCKLKEADVDLTDENRHCFLTLGRLGQRKGTYDLVESIKLVKDKVPDVVCYLAGDGDIENIKNLVMKYKLENNIVVVGWADFNKKIELLKKVATVILPSYNEGLPMSILEGMACGKMIVSTTVGAIPEVVKKENGILVKPGDIVGLANAIIESSLNQELVAQCGNNNRELVNGEFSMEVMHKKLLSYYEDVFEGRGYPN